MRYGQKLPTIIKQNPNFTAIIKQSPFFKFLFQYNKEAKVSFDIMYYFLKLVLLMNGVCYIKSRVIIINGVGLSFIFIFIF